jgi:Protein of unknown function (DUF1615)
MIINKLLLLSVLLLPILVGCSTVGPSLTDSLPRDLRQSEAETPWSAAEQGQHRERLTALMPPALKDKAGWVTDMQLVFSALEIPPAKSTYCAVIAVTEQETGFQADPTVPGLPAIVRGELDRRADKYGIPILLVNAALLKTSPSGQTYQARIDALKTEHHLSNLFDDMIAELPFGRDWLADYNPVHTAGPMQVSIRFAEQHAELTRYPYTKGQRVRDDVFSRRGGLYYGTAILLAYPAPYTEARYRFADFNAGRYSSRNAAFQNALAKLSDATIALDGDLLRYDDDGAALSEPSAVERALRALGKQLKLSDGQIRDDLLQEKTASFNDTSLYERLFQLAEAATGKTLPRQAMPKIALKSPKLSRKLSTEWFADRVDTRFRTCLARGEKH